MIEAWRLVYEAKPFTSNDRLHHMAKAALNEEWINAFAMLARVHRLPKGLDHVTITATHLYTDERYVPDDDNCHPAVKAAKDGLVAAGVVQDDGPAWMGPTTYAVPRKAKRAGLELLVIHEPAPDPLDT